MNADVDKGLDIVVLNGLDFEHVPGCEFGMPNDSTECPESTIWKMTNLCCGSILLLCEQHKQLMANLWRPNYYRHPERLGGCGGSIPSISFEKL